MYTAAVGSGLHLFFIVCGGLSLLFFWFVVVYLPALILFCVVLCKILLCQVYNILSNTSAARLARQKKMSIVLSRSFGSCVSDT